MNSPGQPQAAFGRLRGLLWPIYAHELKKILPMLLMFFFISLVYSLLRNTKDTLIVTAPGGGAEMIPFLKIYGVIPVSVVFMLSYAKLSNVVSKQRLFLLSLVPFVLYFALFAVLYPMRDALEPVAWAGKARAMLPAGLHSLVAMARHWVLVLFYIMAELWGSVALSLLFWGFANDITRVEESKRFYALFGLGANLALIAVKFANQAIQSLAALLAARRDLEHWTAYLTVLMAVVVLCALVIMAIHTWIHRAVLTDHRFYSAEDQREMKRAAPRMSLGEGFAFLLRSRYLRYIALLVLCYGIAINLIEVTWKCYLGSQFPNPADYQDYMSTFSMATGATTLVLMLFVSSNVIRAYGWTVAALVTPVVLVLTGCGFFGFILMRDSFAGLLLQWGTTPLAVGVLFGTVQNVMSKASKYSLFDPTKEMAYIPLDQEAKVKGKAAIDVVGARIGKAGGSLIQQVLIGIYGSLQAVTGQIAVMLLVIIGLWIWAAVRLGRAFRRLTRPAAAPPR